MSEEPKLEELDRLISVGKQKGFLTYDEVNDALPAAVELTQAELGANALPGTLERFEAMRVSVAGAVVVGASEGRIDEPNATASSDGVFYVTLPQVATPFREPGIPALDVTPIPAGKNPPRFDT